MARQLISFSAEDEAGNISDLTSVIVPLIQPDRDAELDPVTNTLSCVLLHPDQLGQSGDRESELVDSLAAIAMRCRCTSRPYQLRRKR